MSQVTASMVKELRERTGVGMGKCKKALDESGGDIEVAIDLLRKSGMASASKKESRETNEGMIAFTEDDNAVVLLEVNVETDFVVKNERFQELMQMFAKEALAAGTESVDQFMAHKCADGRTIEEVRAENIQSMGENIRIKRIGITKKVPDVSIGIYSHMGGRIVTMVEIKGGADQQELARDVAMHVAAESPDYLKPEEIPQDVKDREESIAKEQVKNKPENIVAKILEGKMNSFFDANCLIRQKFVKDSSKTVAAYVAEKGKAVGQTLTVVKFSRWQIGE